jgi:hypothetical protein
MVKTLPGARLHGSGDSFKMQTLADTLPPALIEPVLSPATPSVTVHLSERAAQLPFLGLPDGVKAGRARNVVRPLAHVMVLPWALPLPAVLPLQPPRVKVTGGVELRFPDNEVHVTDFPLVAADAGATDTKVAAEAAIRRTAAAMYAR